MVDGLSKGTFESLAQNPLQIPVCMVGSQSRVRRQAKTLCAVAANHGQWTTVLRQLEYVPIDETESEIVVFHSSYHVTSDRLWPSVFPEALSMACLESFPASSEFAEEEYALHRKLILEGAEYFWWSLCFITYDGLRLPITSPASPADRDRPIIRRLALAKVLRWWPDFRRLSSRMGPRDAGRRWPLQLRHWAHDAGLITEEESKAMMDWQDPLALGEEIGKRLASDGNETGIAPSKLAKGECDVN